ncbi:MAG: hypothetical protein J6P73_04445 [Bacteroidales bacterium]|nr:hypothetical protein [Bacteroidales bacterium]
MKKLFIFCVTLVMMSSCIEHANIYVKLSDEDAAAIPYQLDQTVDFIDQHGDTLTYVVTYDETYPYDQDRYHSTSRTQIYDDYYYYARTVILECKKTGERLGFTIRPQKEFTFHFGEELDLATVLPSGNGNVHHEILHDPDTGELIYDWYYNEENGLMLFKYYDQSLRLLL